MKGPRPSVGAWVGGLTGVLLIALVYLGNTLYQLPFVPFDFWTWQAFVVPRNLLSLVVGGIGATLARIVGAPESAWGKDASQVGAIVISLGILALWGAGIAWLRRRSERRGWFLGAAAGAVLFGVVAAIELTVGMSNPAVALVSFGVLSVAWGATVGSLIEGGLFPSLAMEADAERRRGLIQLAAGTLGAAIVALGIERLVGPQQVAAPVDPATIDAGAPQPDQPLAGIQPTPTLPVTPDATPTPPPSGMAALPVGEDGRIVVVEGTRAEVTPDGQFYNVDISAVPPAIDGTVWRLVIAGMFDQTPRLSLSDLRRYPVHTQPITLACISNAVAGSAISTAYWTGLRLSDLLEDLGLQPSANYLFIESADGFYETVPMEDMLKPETLLVYGMNGRSLPRKHGYPLRIYIPDRFGMKQPKWIERIAATADDRGGYWTDRGWSKEARPLTTAVIDVVAKDQAHDGLIPIGGIAWAGGRGIQRVEVQVDDGPWAEAAIRTPLGRLAWVQWRYEWPSTPGRHTFTARATDGTGELQTPDRRGIAPNGATGYHSVQETI
jgi:DMSO/TMAO reductase YedYZ molybdopterin-dependent catalytic subunit